MVFWNKAKKDGLNVITVANAAKVADIIHILIPDEIQAKVMKSPLKSI